jgi:hypothetical protein
MTAAATRHRTVPVVVTATHGPGMPPGIA